METTQSSSLLDLVKMTRAEKYELAARIITEVSNEWADSGDSEKWQEDHVEEYECTMSFGGLASIRGRRQGLAIPPASTVVAVCIFLPTRNAFVGSQSRPAFPFPTHMNNHPSTKERLKTILDWLYAYDHAQKPAAAATAGQ